MILQEAEKALKIEAQAILSLIPRLNKSFIEAVEIILACKGRIIVSGIGKSGHIARKIAATFSSTGTPSFFIHPAEAIHGDLGMITNKDVLLILSNSGETTELIYILPIVKKIGAKIIGLIGKKNSTLAKTSNIVLDCSIDIEACPLGLAPTSSTTAMLALGDALAIVLLKEKNFTMENFAFYHPGGLLGKKLLLTVENIMHSEKENPIIRYDKTVKEALFIMTKKGLGAVSILDETNKLIGLITDGDIRRGLEKQDLKEMVIMDLMTKKPKTIVKEILAVEALNLMKNNKPNPITVLPVVDNEKKVLGMIHITDIVKTGLI